MQNDVKVLMDQQTKNTLSAVLSGLSEALSPLSRLEEVVHSTGTMSQDLRGVKQDLEAMQGLASDLRSIRRDIDTLAEMNTDHAIQALTEALRLPSGDWLEQKKEV